MMGLLNKAQQIPIIKKEKGIFAELNILLIKIIIFE
jgi:hypothetical protein